VVPPDVRPRFSIILPVHNQADQIDRIAGIVRSAVQRVSGGYEMIFVSNGSRDRTLELAQAAARGSGDILAIEAPRGWGSAVLAGMRAAHGEMICYTNSARVNAADLALALRYSAVNEDVVVKASRKLRERPARRLGSVIYNLECRSLFGLAVWDINGTPKVFHRKILSDLRLTERGDLIDLELLVNAKLSGVPVVEMPVYDTRRLSGKATTNLRAAVRMYSRPLAMRSRLLRRPSAKRVPGV